MNFQINSSSLFLTYPECPINKQELYEVLQDRFQPEKILVAEEKHANGNQHLHCYLKLPQPYRTRDPRFADYKGYHGNYQGCRSSKNVLKYCTKEDNFLANFDVEEGMGKPGHEKTLLGKRILEGASALEIVKDFPKYAFGFKKLKEDVEILQRDLSEQSNEIELPNEVPNVWGLRLFCETDNKKCHFWLFSKGPNKGKTTGTVLPLVRDHKAYLLDPKAIYHRISRKTKVVVLDEVKKGSIEYSTLNQICDETYQYRIFMQGYLTLDEKPLVVVCSNYEIPECFPFKNDLIYARFNEYDVTNLSFQD